MVKEIKRAIQTTHAKTVRVAQGNSERLLGAFALGLILEWTHWTPGQYTHELLVVLSGMILNGAVPDMADRLKGGK